MFSKQEEHRGKAVLASHHNRPDKLVVILPTPFSPSRRLPALRVSTQHVGNWELLNPLPKTRITAHCSMLCPLDAAHRDIGKWPIHCNLNTFVLGRSLGCWDQHLTCFSLNSAESVCSSMKISMQHGSSYWLMTYLDKTALPPSLLCLLQLQRAEGQF